MTIAALLVKVSAEAGTKTASELLDLVRLVIAKLAAIHFIATDHAASLEAGNLRDWNTLELLAGEAHGQLDRVMLGIGELYSAEQASLEAKNAKGR